MKWRGHVAAVLLVSVLQANAAVKAWLQGDAIAAGDTVQLTLEHEGRTDEKPDLAPLEKDFDVLSSSRSSNVQIINGSMSSQTQMHLMLSPKRAGQLTIPAIQWGKERSQPLKLSVSNSPGGGPSASEQASAAKVFLDMKVEPAEPYVQAAVAVTVKLYTAERLFRASMDLPDSADAVIQQIGTDRSATEVSNGRSYQVVERRYLLFPQHSGKLSLAGPVLDAQIETQDRRRSTRDPFRGIFGNDPFGNLMTNTRPIRVRGDDIQLNVRARPAQAYSGYWLPARDVSVTGEWNPDAAQLHVGDPITLNLHLQAEGLTAAQLPDLGSQLALPAGLKAYPDQAKLDNSEQHGTIVGSREQSIALIADQPGKINLPALTVHWWDTTADQPRQTTLPARTLTILPVAGGSAVPNTAVASPRSAVPGAQPESTSSATSGIAVGGNSRWLWVSVALGSLWLLTVLAWFVTSRRLSKPPREIGNAQKNALPPDTSAARQAFHDACRRNDARDARRELLAWLAAAWPSCPTGLRAFAKRLNDEKLTALLLELDRACFAGETWNGAALLEALRSLPAPPSPEQQGGTELTPLYH